MDAADDDDCLNEADSESGGSPRRRPAPQTRANTRRTAQIHVRETDSQASRERAASAPARIEYALVEPAQLELAQTGKGSDDPRHAASFGVSDVAGETTRGRHPREAHRRGWRSHERQEREGRGGEEQEREAHCPEGHSREGRFREGHRWTNGRRGARSSGGFGSRMGANRERSYSLGSAPHAQAGSAPAQRAQEPLPDRGGSCDEAIDACRQSALTLLDAAPRASGALRERLLAKGHGPEIVEDVIARLIRVNLLDDGAYARSVIRYCVGRMYGKRGTLRELRRKGVERSLAESAVREAEDRGVFVDAAWELGRSVAAKTAGLDPAVRKRRFWGAGGRRGHDPQILKEIELDLFDTTPHTGGAGFASPGRD